MFRSLLILCLSALTTLQADEVTIHWQHDGQPEGVTYELQVGESTTTGLTDLEHTADVPTGEPLDIRVRAVPPADNTNYTGPSEWATLTTVVPAAQIGLDIMARGYIEVPWETKPDLAQAEVGWEDSINDGLVAWWLFNEGTGTTLYDIAGRNHGTLISIDPTACWQSSGKYGHALDFLNSAVNAGSDSSLDTLGPMTVSAWIYPRSAGEGCRGVIVDKSNQTVNNWWINLVDCTNRIIEFEHDGVTDLRRFSSNQAFVLNQWQHVVVTWDGSTTAENVHIYVNATEVSYSTTQNGDTLDVNTGTDFYIGRNNGGSRTFDGLLDDIRIYKRELNNQEIQEIYENPLGGLKPRRRFYVIPGGAGSIELTIQGVAHIQSIAPVSLSQASVLQLADIQHLLTMDGLTLAQANTLSANNSQHTQEIESLALIQANLLTLADLFHDHLSENVELTQASTLAPLDTDHSHSMDSAALTQANLIAVADSFHDHLIGTLELSQIVSLLMQDSLHSIEIDPIALLQANTLALQNTDHGHSIDSAELTQANLLAVADSFYGHLINSLELSQAVSITTEDSSHSIEIDLVALLQANALAIDETIHSHNLDSVILTQANTLAIATVLHNLLVDNLELTASGALASLPPDVILASSNLSGTVSNIQDDPDTPDASWLTTINNAVGTDLRVSFPSPSGTPTAGTDRQEFRVLVRRSGASGNGTPDCTVTLYESGIALGATTTLSAFSTEQVISLPWDASLLTNADGSAVECRVQGTTNGGGPNTRTVDIGAIEWNADTGAPSETLIIGDAIHAHTMDTAVLSQANVLSIAELLHSQSIEAIELIQANLLEMADSFHDYLIDTLELSQVLSLIPEDSSHDVSIEPITLTQANTLAVDETGHLHSLETLALTQASTIAPADSQHDHVMEAVILLAGGALDVSDLSHSINLDDLSLIQASLLSVAEIQYSHTTDQLALSQDQTIALSDSQHSQSVDNVMLSEALILAVGDSQHEQSIDNVALLQAGALAVQALLHSHSLESTNLVQASTLVVSSPLHGQTLDSPDLDFSQAVIVQDMGHLQSMESPTLNQAALLSLNDSRHLHTLEQPFLIQTNALIVDELYHVHIIEQSGLAVGFIVTPAKPGIKINAADLTARIRSEKLSITLH